MEWILNAFTKMRTYFKDNVKTSQPLIAFHEFLHGKTVKNVSESMESTRERRKDTLKNFAVDI